MESGSSNWSPSSDTEGDGRTGGASDFRGLFVVVVESWGSWTRAFLFTAVTDVEVLGSGSGDPGLGAKDFYVLGPR